MRLKSLLFSLLMLAGFSMAQATVVEIGSTSLSNKLLPFYSFYKYSYTQQFYPYYEMGASRNLSSISYYSNSSVARTRQIDLYLKNTSKDTFNSNTDWVSVTSSDIVFSGEVTFEPNSWTTITFNNEFNYSGNTLLVAMDDNTGDDPGSVSFAASRCDYDRSLYVYGDNTNYTPSNMSGVSDGSVSYTRTQVRFNEEDLIVGCSESYFMPVITNWKYSMSQQIYRATEIGKKGFIRSISFKNLRTTQTRTIDLYLKPTTKDAFNSNTDWLSVSDDNKVFSGSVTFTSGEWTTIVFDKPYYYDGTNNLAVITNDRTGSYKSLTIFEAYCDMDNQGLQVHNDNSGAYDATNPSSYTGSLRRMKNKIQFDIDDDYYIGDGGTDCAANLPAYAYYCHSLTQQLYTKEELGEARDLTSISFYNQGKERTRNINMYLVPTYATDFSDGNWIAFSDDNLVFSGDVTFYEEAWTTIPFDTPLSYGGKTNLVLVVADNTGDWQTSATFRVFTAANQAIYQYTDNTDAYPTAEKLTSLTGKVVNYKNQIKLNAVDEDLTRPTDLAVQAQPYQVTLTWGGEGSRWNLQYCDESSTWTTVNGLTDNEYTITGLSPNTYYRARVQIVRADGTVSKWTAIEFYTATTRAVDVAATPTPYSADITWTGYSDSYHVMYLDYYNYHEYFYEDFDNGSLSSRGWTVKTNGEKPSTLSEGWVLDNAQSLGANDYNFSFTYSATTYSWTSNPSEMFNADNWLISPLVDVKGTLSFWQFGIGGGDKYEVLLSGSGTDEGDFIYTLRANENVLNGWREVRIDLSQYSDIGIDKGYIAIHFTGYNGYRLRIDDFCIFEGEMGYVNADGTAATIEGLEPNTTYYYRVINHKVGEASNATDWYSFTTLEKNPAPFDLAATPDLTTAEISWTGFSDSYNLMYRKAEKKEATDNAFFFEGFDEGIPSEWTTIDADGDGNNWLALSSIPTTYSYYADKNLSEWAYDGVDAALSASYVNYIGALNTDQYLITPQLDLKGVLKFMEKATDSGYRDQFEVLLSTTGNGISDFTTELRPMQVSSIGWNEVVIDLSAYEGQQGYIAIHHVDYDKYFLAIDNFGLYETVVVEPAGEWQTVENVTSPYVLEGLDKNTEYEYQIVGFKEGEEDAVSDIATFTTITLPDVVLDANSDNDTKISDNNGARVNVTIKNQTIKKDGKWWSICLPFDLELEGSILEGIQLRQPSGTVKEVDTYLIIDCLTECDKIEAGKPYMYKFEPGEDIVDPVFEDVILKDATSYFSLNSDKAGFMPYYYGFNPSSVAEYYYVLDGSLTLGRMNLQKYFYAFDCYFWVDETYNATIDGIGLNFDDNLLDILTGVDKVEAAEKDVPIYNTAGQRLDKVRKGINIIGDKKVLVK